MKNHKHHIPPEIYLAVSTLVSKYRPDLTAEVVAERLIMDLPKPEAVPAPLPLPPPAAPAPARSLSPVEAAGRASVSKKTIHEWIHTGKIAARKLGHRTVRILESDLDKFLATGGTALSSAPTADCSVMPATISAVGAHP